MTLNCIDEGIFISWEISKTIFFLFSSVQLPSKPHLYGTVCHNAILPLIYIPCRTDCVSASFQVDIWYLLMVKKRPKLQLAQSTENIFKKRMAVMQLPFFISQNTVNSSQIIKNSWISACYVSHFVRIVARKMSRTRDCSKQKLISFFTVQHSLPTNTLLAFCKSYQQAQLAKARELVWKNGTKPPHVFRTKPQLYTHDFRPFHFN